MSIYCEYVYIRNCIEYLEVVYTHVNVLYTGINFQHAILCLCEQSPQNNIDIL